MSKQVVKLLMNHLTKTSYMMGDLPIFFSDTAFEIPGKP